MSASREFYVYEHWRPDTGLPFYVGKGKKNRAFSKRRGHRYRRVAKKLEKLGLSVGVRKVFSGLDEAMAFTLECSQISYWRSRGVRLVNHTEGGEGVSGLKHSKKHVARHRKMLLELWESPEFRERHRNGVLAAFKDPVISARHRAATKAAQNRPEVRIQRSRAGKIAQNRPEVRRRNSEAQMEAQNRPEVKARHRVSCLRAQGSPEARKRNSEAQKRAQNRPEVRAQRSCALRAYWAAKKAVAMEKGV